jgi:NADPH-dependent glutamate synthase beta subunit-like oxidoreductase
MQRIGILGSGPAGFYLSERLLKKSTDLYINMIETRPFPFGLIRYGVSPDHPEIKVRALDENFFIKFKLVLYYII